MPTPHYGQPRYRVIADELKERIETGVIRPGALLPTEGALTSEFRASRGTVRRAIDVLREAGLVETQHGRGSSARNSGTSREATEFLEPEFHEREIRADPALAALFNIEAGAILLELERIIRRDGVVQSVIRRYKRPQRKEPSGRTS
ncbi:GntR family transcriptional regulator [Micromonospora aurantiaca]|uniref:GntR family transcriptional regulator n=1 Tax=Micromonospora aurantiaca (nom. illeg.) TaxID=47850 RepID=UPI0034543881